MHKGYRKKALEIIHDLNQLEWMNWINYSENTCPGYGEILIAGTL
jgi:hypothetical protein